MNGHHFLDFRVWLIVCLGVFVALGCESEEEAWDREMAEQDAQYEKEEAEREKKRAVEQKKRDKKRLEGMLAHPKTMALTNQIMDASTMDLSYGRKLPDD